MSVLQCACGMVMSAADCAPRARCIRCGGTSMATLGVIPESRSAGDCRLPRRCLSQSAGEPGTPVGGRVFGEWIADGSHI